MTQGAQTSQPKVFVSYASEDKAFALDVVGGLERHGVPCWISCRDIPAGRDFDHAIAAAMESCYAAVLLFSEHCNTSAYVLNEVRVLQEIGKLLIPFRIEDARPRDGLRTRLLGLQWIDGFREGDFALDQLIDALTLYHLE
jgi:hypothetical protein